MLVGLGAKTDETGEFVDPVFACAFGLSSLFDLSLLGERLSEQEFLNFSLFGFFSLGFSFQLQSRGVLDFHDCAEGDAEAVDLIVQVMKTGPLEPLISLHVARKSGPAKREWLTHLVIGIHEETPEFWQSHCFQRFFDVLGGAQMLDELHGWDVPFHGDATGATGVALDLDEFAIAVAFEIDEYSAIIICELSSERIAQPTEEFHFKESTKVDSTDWSYVVCVRVGCEGIIHYEISKLVSHWSTYSFHRTSVT